MQGLSAIPWRIHSSAEKLEKADLSSPKDLDTFGRCYTFEIESRL
jgi:hypothetical protein